MESSAKIEAKLQKLAQMAEDLRKGSRFPITRLTMLKSLCRDPKAAARFVLFLAERVRKAVAPKHRPLVSRAVSRMKAHLKKPTKKSKSALWESLDSLRAVQDKYKRIKWGTVRLIESREVLLVEKALQCILRPSESEYWAYDVAGEYAERYSPRHGTGLIRESAPMVEDIASFWCKHCLGKTLKQWLRSRSGKTARR